MSSPIERTLMVGCKDYFGLRVSKWVEDEEITNCSAESLDELVTIESCSVDNSGSDPIIKFTVAAGQSPGLASIKVNFSTATRPNYRVVQIYVNK